MSMLGLCDPLGILSISKNFVLVTMQISKDSGSLVLSARAEVCMLHVLRTKLKSVDDVLVDRASTNEPMSRGGS